MYDILKDLCSCKVLELHNIGERAKAIYSLKDSEFKMWNKTYKLSGCTEEELKDSEGIYNNGTLLVNDPGKTEITLLQDYGTNFGDMEEDGEEEIEPGLFDWGFDFSLGFSKIKNSDTYNLLLVSPFLLDKRILVAWDLNYTCKFKMDELFSSKRPYYCYFYRLVGEDDIYFKFNAGKNCEGELKLSGIKVSDITSLDYVSDKIDFYKIHYTERVITEEENYITYDTLIRDGFDYSSSSDRWRKTVNGKTLTINSELADGGVGVCPDEDTCLFTVNELDEYMKKYFG
jgi:hypothetical protein